MYSSNNSLVYLNTNIYIFINILVYTSSIENEHAIRLVFKWINNKHGYIEYLGKQGFCNI